MKRGGLIGLAALSVLTASAGSAVAQDVTAEVRTWGGQSWRLTEPSLEVFYTIVPQASGRPGEGEAAPGGEERFSATIQALGRRQPQRAPEPLQGHGQSEVLTISRQGVTTHLPLARIASLAFSRQPVAANPFPPYVVPTLYRHAVTAVLTDGSRVEADYVNLGTTVLRGMTPQGGVDVPWDDIESIRFQPGPRP